MALIQSTAIPSGATDYELEQSLRFNQDDSPFLNKTFASASNQKTFTYSGWIKLGDLTFLEDHYRLFGAGGGGSNSQNTGIDIDSSFRINVYASLPAPTVHMNLITTAKLRDPSAWYHILVVIDTTQGTDTNRVKIYINGVQQTAFDTATYPTQNLDTYINTATQHTVGTSLIWSNQSTQYGYLDGYMAEVNFIDGTAKAPADFGETGDYGEWKPIEYEGSYGNNGFYLSFAGGGTMSATGGTITTDGDYKVHSFTSSGTFTPTSINNGGDVEYLVIAGGGGGGAEIAGGGGAGGYRTGYLAVTEQAYTVTVGAGAASKSSSASPDAGDNGSDSIFASITSLGGGGGGGPAGGVDGGRTGGSGGGAKVHGSSGASGTSGQGNAGGSGSGDTYGNGGGGGGSGGVGANGGNTANSTSEGAGGAGTASSITGSSVTRAGGGGGGSWSSSGQHTGGSGGSGGGQQGYGNQISGYTTNRGTDNSLTNGDITLATVNTGSGGGGGGNNGGFGGAGASGIVIIRYKFQ